MNDQKTNDALTESRLNVGLGIPKPNTEVSDIVRDWLKLNNFDGLCHGESECGCHFDDFLICQGDGGAFPQCRPAYKFIKRNGEWWMSTNKYWEESDDA